MFIPHDGKNIVQCIIRFIPIDMMNIHLRIKSKHVKKCIRH